MGGAVSNAEITTISLKEDATLISWAALSTTTEPSANSASPTTCLSTTSAVIQFASPRSSALTKKDSTAGTTLTKHRPFLSSFLTFKMECYRGLLTSWKQSKVQSSSL